MSRRTIFTGMAVLVLAVSSGCCGPCGGCWSLCNWYPGKHLHGVFHCGCGGYGYSGGCCDSCGGHDVGWDGYNGDSPEYYDESVEPTPAPTLRPSGWTTRNGRRPCAARPVSYEQPLDGSCRHGQRGGY